MRPGSFVKLFLYLPLCLATLGLTSISCGSDGGWIVINYGAKIYFVSSDGKHLREVAPLPEEGKKTSRSFSQHIPRWYADSVFNPETYV